MAKTYIATVHLLIEAEGDGEAADTISSLLSENGKYTPGSGVLDWAYASTAGQFRHAREIVNTEGLGESDDWTGETWEALA